MTKIPCPACRGQEPACRTCDGFGRLLRFPHKRGVDLLTFSGLWRPQPGPPPPPEPKQRPPQLPFTD